MRESHKEVGERESITRKLERESHKEVGVKESDEEAGEEPAKVGWTCGKNGRGTIDEESGCSWSGG